MRCKPQAKDLKAGDYFKFGFFDYNKGVYYVLKNSNGLVHGCLNNSFIEYTFGCISLDLFGFEYIGRGKKIWWRKFLPFFIKKNYYTQPLPPISIL